MCHQEEKMRAKQAENRRPEILNDDDALELPGALPIVTGNGLIFMNVHNHLLLLLLTVCCDVVLRVFCV